MKHNTPGITSTANTFTAIPKSCANENSVNLVFSTDKNYLNQLGVCLSSLITNINPGRYYDITILYSDLEKSDIDKFLSKIYPICPNNIFVRFYDVTPWLRKIDLKSLYIEIHVTISSYFRLFIQEIFSNYERILYLDSDLIINGDLCEIYDITPSNFEYIAASLDIRENYAYQQNIKIRKTVTWRDYVNSKLGIYDDQTYFQAGVMLFFLGRMRERRFNLLSTCLKELQRIKTPILSDQDISNSALKGYVKFIETSWNLEWQIPFEFPEYKTTMSKNLLAQYTKASRSPKIIHYASSRKPWNEPDLYLSPVWWKYARSSLFYNNFIKNEIANLPLKDIEDIAHLILSRLLTHLKYKILSRIGIKKKHYDTKLKNIK